MIEKIKLIEKYGYVVDELIGVIKEQICLWAGLDIGLHQLNILKMIRVI